VLVFIWPVCPGEDRGGVAAAVRHRDDADCGPATPWAVSRSRAIATASQLRISPRPSPG
jgi:hypothetical protein